MAEYRLRAELLELRLKRAFNLSQASAESKKTLIVRYGEGIGEGSSSIHYGVSSESNHLQLTAQLVTLEEDLSPDVAQQFARALPPELNVSRCAVEMALLDCEAKRRGQPLHEFLGLPAPDVVTSSFTVTAGSPDEIKQQMESVAAFRAIKLKVGFDGDLKLVDDVLKLRAVRLRLDANGGWTRDETVERLRALSGYPIDFIEQPMTDPKVQDLDFIKTKRECRIFLDESIRETADIERFREVVDGVNLKLSKCGGIINVVTMANLARTNRLQLLLGCMIESAVGITAGLHLASLFDFFDLDAILLTENDPYWGAQFEGDRLLLPRGPGIGVNVRENALA